MRTAALWRKETRFLAPFILLLLLLAALDLAGDLITESPQAWTLANGINDEDRHIEHVLGGVVLAILALALTSGLLVREFDTETIEFLDALPVSRLRVFLVKSGVALAVLALFFVATGALDLLLHALSRTSLDPSFHSRLLGTQLLLDFAQAFVFVALGLLLSYLRRFAWVVAGLLAWVYWLLQPHLPQIALVNVLALASPQFAGSEIVFPWRMLAVQLPLGAAALALAGAIYCGAAGRLLRFYASWRHTLLGRFMPFAGIAAILGLVVSLIAVIAHSLPDTPDEDAPQFRSWATSNVTTAHYRFAYPGSEEKRALELAAVADPVQERIAAYFGESDAPRLAVDLSGAGEQHLGLAFWKTMRLGLASTRSLAEARAVLAHETTHVFIEMVSDQRLGDSFDSTQFFHEGYASWIEHRFYRTPEELARERSVAAVTHARERVRFDELIDSAALARKRDIDLVYPLGELFIAALAETAGERAPVEVARAFGRPGAPRDLDGIALWQDIFQAAGLNLERVIARWREMLDAEVKANAALIALLPRLRGRLDMEQGEPLIRVDANPPPGWIVVCRLRPAPDAPREEYIFAHPGKDDAFVIPDSMLLGRGFGYGLGLLETKTRRVIYEPWSQTAL